MGVELPVWPLDAVERRLVPSHGVRERGLEYTVVATQQPEKPLGQRVARAIIEIRQPRNGPARNDQRLERPCGPERDTTSQSSSLPRSLGPPTSCSA